MERWLIAPLILCQPESHWKSLNLRFGFEMDKDDLPSIVTA